MFEPPVTFGFRVIFIEFITNICTPKIYIFICSVLVLADFREYTVNCPRIII
ncbi:hypothetical protein OMAG_001949 [Candidatus Omnitrophus magneticus]|uniref:Uncharacterized protein n=1 Tax=Candidatus Omnitrophus magneticus TaxID=1609969 RepID=A0A0F0CJ35_9BACT|nr:hypothetical protein OMAG_002826 [Candidatus Omnitrophus magneticus]KJJ84182.1 hypothetical protein OMAG_001949 [Candidatus Omnitrophus magneticus]